MKTTNLILALMLAAPIQVAAQQYITINADEHSLCVIPGTFTFDSKPKIHSSNFSEETGVIKVYDDELTEVASIDYNPVEYLSYRHQTRHIEVAWNAPWVIESESYDEIHWADIRFLDLRSGTIEGYSDADVLLTQTLFNDDEKYEYIKPKYILTKEEEKINRDESGDYEDIYTYWNVSYLGFEVVSEDGNVVFSLDFDRAQEDNFKDEPEITIVLWEDKIYLAISSEENYGATCDMYLLKRNESGISAEKAGNIGAIKLFPSVARKSSMVTVDLGEKLNNSNGVLSITDMNGKTIYTQHVEPGTTATQIPTNRLSLGMYIVWLNVQGDSYETAKLIVK